MTIDIACRLEALLCEVAKGMGYVQLYSSKFKLKYMRVLC